MRTSSRGVPTTSCEAEAKGSKLGYSASFAHVPSAQHESQIGKPGPSDPSPRSTISTDTKEGGEELGHMQLALLDLKRQQNFRQSFLRKLSYQKVWVPTVHRPPKHQTVIIFDWDDTLLCTHFLSLYDGTRTIPKALKAHLRFIGMAVKRLLEKSIQLGQTFIITNAAEGWVEYSAALFVPVLLPILQKIHIISARSRYEKVYPSDVSQWKISAFMELQKELDLPLVTNLIAIGDQNYELDAAHIMGGEFAEAVVKTIKFKENPSAEELVKELELVEDKFEGFVEDACNWKMRLKLKAP